MIGQTLGPYKILEALGAGGMGEVFLAEDTRLGRKVAIKVLPPEFAADPERLARFAQEARAAAALNHPHIAAVYDIGFEEGGAATEVKTDPGIGAGQAATGPDTGTVSIPATGVHFIVQEYLEGDTLRKPLDAGAMPLKKVLALATEIAEALGAAHAAGIVHRDLKPENIFITKDGHAKVLDFGLAKLTEIAPAMSGSASMSPTFLGTIAGQIMGTAGYMSPEQVNGEEVDGRADLFAFGCVLYEMATGRRAFSGKNLPETMHKLANVDPVPMTELSPELPLQLQWIADKTLAKDPAERYQAAGELIVDLRRLAEEGDRAPSASAIGGVHAAAGSVDSSANAAKLSTIGTGADPTAGIVPRAAPWAIAAVAIAFGAWALARPTPPAADRTPLFLPLGQVHIDSPDNLDISPDGSQIVFVDDNRLQLIDLTQGPEAQAIPDTEDARSPAFSPDGSWIAFVADGELRKIRPSGGALPTTLTAEITDQAFGVSWGGDGRIFYTPDWPADILGVSQDGGDVEVIASPDPALDEQNYVWASLLPDGEHLLYSMWDTHWNIAVRSLIGGETRILFEDFHDARYVPTGHLVFAQEQQLFAATFDLETLEAGEPYAVVDNVMTSIGDGSGAYAFSDTGTLVYLEGAGDPSRELWRVDRDGTRTLLTERREPFAWVEISPDNDRLALTVLDARDGQNLALLEIERDRFEYLTSGKHWSTVPVFSPDGRQLLYVAEDQDDYVGFRIRSLDASAADETVPPPDLTAWESSWGADGSIFYSGRGGDGDDTSINIFVLEPGVGEPRLVVGAPDDQRSPSLSLDGTLLAFRSDQTGRSEVYVMSYPPRNNEPPYQVSSDGGTSPRWSDSGETMWFRDGENILAAEILDGEPRTSAPTVVFQGIDEVWDIAADGSFLVTLDLRDAPQMRMILNWFEDLKAKVPTGR